MTAYQKPQWCEAEVTSVFWERDYGLNVQGLINTLTDKVSGTLAVDFKIY